MTFCFSISRPFHVDRFDHTTSSLRLGAKDVREHFDWAPLPSLIVCFFHLPLDGGFALVSTIFWPFTSIVYSFLR